MEFGDKLDIGEFYKELKEVFIRVLVELDPIIIRDEYIEMVIGESGIAEMNRLRKLGINQLYREWKNASV